MPPTPPSFQVSTTGDCDIPQGHWHFQHGQHRNTSSCPSVHLCPPANIRSHYKNPPNICHFQVGHVAHTYSTAYFKMLFYAAKKWHQFTTITLWTQLIHMQQLNHDYAHSKRYMFFSPHCHCTVLWNSCFWKASPHLRSNTTGCF